MLKKNNNKKIENNNSLFQQKKKKKISWAFKVTREKDSEANFVRISYNTTISLSEWKIAVWVADSWNKYNDRI